MRNEKISQSLWVLFSFLWQLVPSLSNWKCSKKSYVLGNACLSVWAQACKVTECFSPHLRAWENRKTCPVACVESLMTAATDAGVNPGKRRRLSGWSRLNFQMQLSVWVMWPSHLWEKDKEGNIQSLSLRQALPAPGPGRPGLLPGRQLLNQCSVLAASFFTHCTPPPPPSSSRNCVCFLRFREMKNVSEFTSSKQVFEPLGKEVEGLV